jgi:class 3 adenylate cyclase
MRDALPFALLEKPEQLATYNGWSEEVYRDLLAFQAGRMSHAELDAKYLYRATILTLDMTGFTASCFEGRQAEAFLRILNAQKVCIPVLHDHDATLVRAFADDLVALFDDPGKALDAAQEIHRRIELFNASGLATENPAYCSIGIGFGDVYRIGPNLSMGDEMNRSSKLGEDTARGAETLVTESFRDALEHRKDVQFEPVIHDDILFPYFRVSKRPERE